MSRILGLTAEQEAFAAHPAGPFLHACPGAGKTRTIIARLERVTAPLPERRGIAVLSFTNSAVDEFRDRCQAVGLDSLLRYPSFMGTLDAFVRHFVVLPVCSAIGTVRPVILDSWARMDISIRLQGQYAYRGDGVSLDLFDPETNVINPTRIGHSDLRNHVGLHRARYEREAANRRRSLLQAGYLSAGDARILTRQLIRDPVQSGALGRALAARFHEVMVDEGQDCNPLDLEILSWLRAYGVQVTFVCDPDQSIYQFRNGTPADVQTFKDTYPAESQLPLTGNFRSSPAICRLAGSIRSSGQVDRSVSETANVAHPVLLLSYRGGSPTAVIGQAFLDQIAHHRLDATKAVVLAHSSKVAQRAAGITPNDADGRSRTEALARLTAEFWSSDATARAREVVTLSVEAMLLDLMQLRQADEHLLRAIERLGLDRRAHRRRALELLMRLPKVCGTADADRLAWLTHARSEVERLNLPLQAGVTVRGFFRQPSGTDWSSHLRPRADLGLRTANIHEAKGHEYDSVCVVIPPNRAPENRVEALFQSWEARTDSEAKRVLYVGVTRARRLCALAVPLNYAARCEALFAARAVPHSRRDL